MVNTLFLPELREMLADNNVAELHEFCEALHPARTADFMDGLEPAEIWRVLAHTTESNRVTVFEYLPLEMQQQIIETQDLDEMAGLVSQLTSDERVDILQDIDQTRLASLLQRLPVKIRREVLRLSQYPEGTAGSLMATEFVAVPEHLTIRQAIDEIARQADHYETIYYLFIVDDDDHLRGIVTARDLMRGMRQPDTPMSELMNTAVITVNVLDDQQDVVNKVAKLDVLAIPVIDQERRIVGIVTHDDVIDLVRDEATDDALRSAAVEPLEDTYLRTPVLELSWKRGVWLAILLCFALIPAFSLKQYEDRLNQWAWLIAFIPLIISSGGNSGNQSATLVITALSQGHASGSDWFKIVVRELCMGLLLGIMLAVIGTAISILVIGGPASVAQAMIVPVTLVLVVTCGAVLGASLPLVFRRLGLDPALMSNPFVAGICDILGIVIYMNVAWLMIG